MNEALPNVSLYHRFLRIAVLTATLVLVFDSGIITKDTARLADMATGHVATVVGVAASVEPNEVNQLTGRITELENELEAKERLIAVNVRDNSSSASTNTSTVVLSVIVFVLLCLIILNYVLDYLRRPIVINRREPA
jgi:hypothetical protein